MKGFKSEAIRNKSEIDSFRNRLQLRKLRHDISLCNLLKQLSNTDSCLFTRVNIDDNYVFKLSSTFNLLSLNLHKVFA